MLIYKYTGHAKVILGNGTIKVSRAADFNDPFELSPIIGADSFGAKAIREMLLREHVIDEFFVRETGGLTISRADYEKQYRKTLSARVIFQTKNSGGNAEFLRAEFANIFDSHQRIFCASKRRDSILMWSHYANQHKGCVLEFDNAKPPFGELREWMVQVDYVAEKVKYRYDPNPKRWRSNLFPVVAAKFKDWCYEEEVRFIFPASGPEFVPLHPATVRTVILGSRIPDSDRAEILAILTDSRYAHVDILHSRMCKDRFALEFETIRAGV